MTDMIILQLFAINELVFKKSMGNFCTNFNASALHHCSQDKILLHKPKFDDRTSWLGYTNTFSSR